MRVDPIESDRVPPSSRMNYRESAGRFRNKAKRLTFLTAVTTDMSRLETLAWTATVVVCNVWPAPTPESSMNTTMTAFGVCTFSVDKQPLPMA